MEHRATHRLGDGPEVILPVARRVLGGHGDEGPSYANWRKRGTDDWLLIHTVAGAGRLAGPDDHFFTTVGDAVLLRPHSLHDYRTTPSERHWEIAYAHFHPRPEWGPLLDWPERVAGVGVIRTESEVHQRVVVSLLRCARMSVGVLARSDLFAVNALEEALLWYDTQNPLTTRTDERILRVIDYVDAHLAEPLDVRHMAEIAHISASRLTHLFSEQLGISPQRYVERQRMTLAQQLLAFTSRPIGQIARDVGHSDPLYFSQRFRRYTGTTPTSYRRRGKY